MDGSGMRTGMRKNKRSKTMEQQMKRAIWGQRRWTAIAVLATIFTALAGAGSALAQEFRGTISGAIADPTGAALPGADVTVRETHTGTTNKTKSDSAGQYVVPFLLPGTYSITATMQGFEKTTRDGVTVEAQAHP